MGGKHHFQSAKANKEQKKKKKKVIDSNWDLIWKLCFEKLD